MSKQFSKQASNPPRRKPEPAEFPLAPTTPAPEVAPEQPVFDLRPSASALGSRLTIEAGVYAALFALALALRLYRLGLAPLSGSEAELALSALRGSPAPVGASPLLLSLNSILFAVFGGGDALARLIPALAGAALVISPVFWRERIGRVGALGAAALLAISPVAVMTSRTASGEALVALVWLGLAGAADQFLRMGRTGWVYAGAALLGAGLACGHLIYSALLMLAAAAAALGFATGGEGVRERWQAMGRTPRVAGRVIGVLAAVLAASATALMVRPGGLSAAINLLSVWLADFSFGMVSWPWAFQVLALYEPLVVVMGMAGLFFALQRDQRFMLLPIVSLVVALLLVIARAGRMAGDVLLVVVPLALLGGYTFQTLADSLRSTRFTFLEGVLVLVMLPAIGYLALGAAGYIQNPNAVPVTVGTMQLQVSTQAIQVILALALMVIVITLFLGLINAEASVRGATMSILIALALASWGAGWNAAQNNPGDPREIILGPQATAPAVRTLVRDLGVLSAAKTANPSTLVFAVRADAAEPILQWYLRDMPGAQFTASLEAASSPAAFVTVETGEAASARKPELAGSYAGQRFTVQQTWSLGSRSSVDTLRWVLYREADLPQPTRQATLWVRLGQ